MSRFRFHSSGSGGGRLSDQTLDPSTRRALYGRIRPMREGEEPGWLQQLLRRLV